MDLQELQKTLEEDSSGALEYALECDEGSFSEAAQNWFDGSLAQEDGRHQPHQGRPPLVEQGPQVVAGERPQEIDLSKLTSRVNWVWKDKVFCGKTIRPSKIHGSTLWTLVEDSSSGMSVVLSLWNFLHVGSDGRILQGVSEKDLPPESYLILHQPLLVPHRTQSSSPNHIMFKVDNPQCLEILDTREAWEVARRSLLLTGAFHQSLPTKAAEEVRQAAEQALAEKRYHAASRGYSQMLQRWLKDGDEEEVEETEKRRLCQIELAEAQFQMGRYEDAKESAERALKDANPVVAARTKELLARCLLYLGQSDSAKDLLLGLRQEDPENKSVQALLGDCLQAIMEAKLGNYNLRKMLLEAALYTELPFHADYRSPKITLGVPIVRSSDGEEYRGVRAEADIPEGMLLTSTRAFAFAHHPRSNEGPDQIAQKKYLYEVRQVHQAVQRLMNEPSLAPSLYRLEAAGEIDEESETTGLNPTINLAKIRGILESNRFGVDLKHPSSPFELKPPQEERVGDPVGVGLWLDTSMFNHSCTPNAAWTAVGNQMFVYATKEIPKGAEICISYVHVASSYEDRAQRFSKWNGGKGFACGCEWCHMMRSEEGLRGMNQKVHQAHRRLTSGNEEFGSIDEVLSKAQRKKIKKAHAKLPKRFHHTLYTVHMMEALQFANEGDRRAARDSVMAAVDLGYAIRGGLRQETRTQDLCALVAVHMACNEDVLARKTLETLCRQQVILPKDVQDFQNFVMMSSMPFWGPYQHEAFVQRWALLIQQVWESRSRELHQ